MLDGNLGSLLYGDVSVMLMDICVLMSTKVGIFDIRSIKILEIASYSEVSIILTFDRRVNKPCFQPE